MQIRTTLCRLLLCLTLLGLAGAAIPAEGTPDEVASASSDALVGQTVNDPRYTPLNFRAALNKEPLGWVYQNPALPQQETLERAL